MTYVISGRNINDLYPQALHFVNRDGVEESSRAGPVKVVPFPIVTATDKPMERVLFDPVRDANPFFHMFECLWMLGGSDDGRWLDRFVGDFSSRFGQEDGSIWGAYGYRWRTHFQFDQLEMVIEKLKYDPKDRRVVIAMWDPVADLNPSFYDSAIKDVPCNTHIYPRIVNGALDLSVCVRSNDVIWGAYGANAVHMTFLQEYLAGRIGVPVGKFYQFSNNWHAYTNVLEKYSSQQRYSNPYVVNQVKSESIMSDPDRWDRDLVDFLNDPEGYRNSTNLWFFSTAQKAWMAHKYYKEKNWQKALDWASVVGASDWSLAMVQWIKRRQNNWELKNAHTE